jgi:hypothetical protein
MQFTLPYILIKHPALTFSLYYILLPLLMLMLSLANFDLYVSPVWLCHKVLIWSDSSKKRGGGRGARAAVRL